MMALLMLIGGVYLSVSVIAMLVLIAIFGMSGRTNSAPQHSSKPNALPVSQVVHPQQTHIQSV